jgi:hypothetical protein
MSSVSVRTNVTDITPGLTFDLLTGSFRDLSQVTAKEILDNTVLNADTAQAVEDFFKSEYVVE